MFKRGRVVRNSEGGFIDLMMSVSAEETKLPRQIPILCHALWLKTRGEETQADVSFLHTELETLTSKTRGHFSSSENTLVSLLGVQFLFRM